MKLPPLAIHPDIRKAHTLPAVFYQDLSFYEASMARIFQRSWHYLAHKAQLPEAGHIRPVSLLPDSLAEPLLLTHDGEQLRCLSNVCTHRANLLADAPGPCTELRCRYHGRRFELTGQFKSMPEFQDAIDFPSDSDHLPIIQLKQWGPLAFTSLNPFQEFEEWFAPILERLPWLPIRDFEPAPVYTKVYDIPAHWALYCDNFLEGFHIPFVHPNLNQVLSYPDYQYELFEWGSLQVGHAKAGEQVFEIPAGHPDADKHIAAYYFWLFPNLMLNFYPWGLSVNVVEPTGPTHCQVRFETFVWKPELYDASGQEALHQTELEDEEVVASVQQGIHSSLYDRGRYSPKMEVAVHHFHRMIAAAFK